jgi:DNA polymerase-3 subunit alpha
MQQALLSGGRKLERVKQMSIGWVNLHRHSEFSLFDGFGKQTDAANYAARVGQTALGIAEHGSVSGLVEHYQACKKAEIKPILGCEVYFQPTFDKDKKYYHMCLFCKDMQGYQNLMRLITEANSNNFYRVGIVTGELLKKYNKGLICTTACLAGYVSRPILDDKTSLAKKRLLQLKEIFGNDLYVELMPYSVKDENGVDIQKKVDLHLMRLSKDCGVKAIITCDSHYIAKEDYDTYKIMFKIGNKEMYGDYSQRYMPSEEEIRSRFEKAYKTSAKPYLKNTKEIADKCEVDLESFKEDIPKIDFGEDSQSLIKKLVKRGLKRKGKWDKQHYAQAKEELDVIFSLGFEDYFLLCWDIIKFALDNNIGYGRGRGSVCGSIVAYALNITDVDPLEMGTVFERFLRRDKHKMPDIDMDFESNRRQEVIEYIYRRFAGRAIQVAIYGYYKVNNLVNDIGKVLEVEKEEMDMAKEILGKMYPELVHGTQVSYEEIIEDKFMLELEKKYEFVKHFSKLCGQVRYIGKHAGGVAITCGDLSTQLAAIKVAGALQSCYDLSNLDYLKVLKIDILGLSTVSVIKNIEVMTGVKYSDEMYKDPEVIEEFRKVNTTGIFQFEKAGAKAILQLIEPDNIQDLISATALNRPAPLQLGMPERFAEAKRNRDMGSETISSKYLPETYGCLVYQEDIIRIGRGIADMTWDNIDLIMKGLKSATDLGKKVREQLKDVKVDFIKAAVAKNPAMKKRKGELDELFEEMTGGYLFNKGHAAGYVLLSVQMMYYKHYYPLEFWTAMLMSESDERKVAAYESEAVKDGIIIIPAHINGTANYGIVEYGGGKCISRGISSIKGIGPKAAEMIQANGPYYDRADFEEKVEKRICNARVMRLLEENGAFEFNDDKWLRKIKWENTNLYSKQLQIR